ncbi:MAG TPA: hypothetical protein PLC42_04465 [Parachlamydiaceae bacterium]|nr:hypothetical protein [Parachlamydiaceae bacterium]
MKLSDIQFIFNRAMSKSFNLKKLLLVFVALALCGVLVVFFRGLAVNAGHWLILSLSFLPIFLCSGFLLSVGIFLIRVYHDEVKNKPFKYGDILSKSWEIILGSSYFSVPIILCYLLIWMLLGIFFLLRDIPSFGEFFAVILAFAPFLINLASLLLCLLNFALLFFATPVIALKGFDKMQISKILMNRIQGDLFSNLLFALIASLPFLFATLILSLAAFLTGTICYTCKQPVYTVLQWFVIMIPFTALLSPTIVFFFNFAAEAHVLLQKELKKNHDL